MSEREGEFVVRRILVALDASAHSLAALAAAVDLAAAMEAELEGLFVEDINLLRLASLPFTVEVRHTASVEALDSPKMERALKAQAEQARQALASAAGHLQLRWSFRVVRGHVAQEVLAAASRADLVTLGKLGRSKSPRARLGSTALRVASGTSGALLLVEHGVPAGPPVLVIYDGSQAAQRALDAASRLAAKSSGAHLTVLLLADTLEEGKRLEQEVSDRIEGRRLRLRFHSLLGADLPSLVRAIHSEEGGLVVLSTRSTALAEEAVQELLDRVRNAVLLVR